MREEWTLPDGSAQREGEEGGEQGERGVDLPALRRQEEQPFITFVRAYEPLVLGLAQSMGLGDADRDDVAAETFAVAYRMLPAFRGDSKLSTWLYRIAWRTAVKVRRRYPRRGGAELGELAGGDAPVGGAIEEAENADVVWRAVDRLDPEQAAAVELYYRRGLPVEEVARVMEKPEGTIKTLLYRARERLKRLLGSVVMC